jgi:hypothetical protein
MFMIGPRTQFTSLLKVITVSMPNRALSHLGGSPSRAAQTAKRLSLSVVIQGKADFGKCVTNDLAFEWNGDPARRINYSSSDNPSNLALQRWRVSPATAPARSSPGEMVVTSGHEN